MGAGYRIAIETSVSHGSVALCIKGEIIFSSEFEAGRRPSELLPRILQEALGHVGSGSVELVLIGTGPGSYNGARVGIASGQGIAIVHRCPVVGISSLEGLAAVRSGVPCLALGDARRGTFFTLELKEGKLAGSPSLLEHPEFQRRAGEAGGRDWTLVSLEEPQRLDLPDHDVLVEVPSAALLLEAWQERSPEEQQKLLEIPPEPFYLRAPHITQPKRGSGPEPDRSH